MHDSERVRDLDLSTDSDYVFFHRHTYVANIDVVVASGEIRSGTESQCNVEVTGAARQRTHTGSRIVIAVRVALQRNSTSSRVFEPGCIGNERFATARCVTGARCVLKKRLKALSRV